MFSWSLEDIFNQDLYTNKVDYIYLSFHSLEKYYQSFVYPLLDETRAQLCSSVEILSSSPFAEVISLEHSGSHSYGILDEEIKDDDGDDTKLMSTFKVIASKDIGIDELGKKTLFIMFLTNITPNRIIWNALHMNGDSKLIKKILCASDVVEENYYYCYMETNALSDDETYQRFSSELNESQNKAICGCLSSFHYNHKSIVDLIWGPPRTGKTKTLGTLLYALLKMNCRTLVYAPKNVAIKEVASRVLSMVRESFDRNADDLICNL
ncbi:hypothetical protein RYX36_009274 [Vicia faba]